MNIYQLWRCVEDQLNFGKLNPSRAKLSKGCTPLISAKISRC